MFGLRLRGFTSHTSTTKVRILIVLVAVASICTLLTFQRVLATTIVSDDFNDNSLDTTKWTTNLFSGYTNTNVPLGSSTLVEFSYFQLVQHHRNDWRLAHA